MRITIIGAGSIGSAVARHLAARDDVDEIRVCDSGSRMLTHLHDTVQSKKVRSYQVDGRDDSVLKPILKGSNCIIGCASPLINPGLARMSLEVGSHFCDPGGNEDVVREELELAHDARERGIWIVPNCGLAPGLINMLCLLGIDQFDRVDSAQLRVGDVPVEPEPPFNFRLSVSARKLIDDYTMPAFEIRDGELRETEPLMNVELIRFRDPFGTLEAFSTAGSLLTLANQLSGRVRNLDMKTIRWPGHAEQMRFLLGLGFGEKKIIDIRTHLTYNDVLVRRMQKMLGGEYVDAVLLRASIFGVKDGEERTLVYEMLEGYGSKDGMSAMRRCTSVPVAVVAHMLASGSVQGAGAESAEVAMPRTAVIEELNRCGLDIHSSWHQGRKEVTEPAEPVGGLA